MIIDDLTKVADFLSNEFSYKKMSISNKVIALAASDHGARVIVAISQDEDSIDIAFSPTAVPSEVATIMLKLNEEFMYDINVTQDFYLASDKEMYLGLEAMSKFAEDLHQMVEDAKFEEECNEDGSPLLDDSVFVVSEPLEVATPESMRQRHKRKYKELWELSRRN